MKKKFLFIFILSCFILTTTYSQNDYSVSGGVLGAANFGKFRVNDENSTTHSNIDYELKTGWVLGAWLNIPVSNGFSIEPQVMYSAMRYLTNSTSPNVLINDGKIGYVSVPLLLKFHMGDQFAFVLGPQVDFVTAVKNNSGSTAQESDFNQASFSGTAGIEIFPHGNVTIFGRYIHGFSDMKSVDDATMPKYKNLDIQVGLKLRLFGKRKSPPYQATTTTMVETPLVDTTTTVVTKVEPEKPVDTTTVTTQVEPEKKVEVPEVREVSDKLNRVVSTEASYIQFKGRTTTFTVRSNTSLNHIVTILNENPDLKVKIEGHTDNAGDDEANMKLSTDRADAVKAYLVEKGISEDRITTEGFGETMPIADNNTASGRMKNRRVEIKLSY